MKSFCAAVTVVEISLSTNRWIEKFRGVSVDKCDYYPPCKHTGAPIAEVTY